MDCDLDCVEVSGRRGGLCEEYGSGGNWVVRVRGGGGEGDDCLGMKWNRGWVEGDDGGGWLFYML